ncbi:uncharacterized protein BYT42DRAFT_483189, partial [Radiomyces spectabilis]|uniref:uncharacterized protein n=1 Tax=Radiomyces spectabilis TaxID=64574 RepID=UPI00221F44DD
LEEKIQALSRERSTFDSTLAELEDALQAKRDYANQRRLKKSKREKQYHHFYSIPMIASRYEKKYIRARDKNAQAEDQLCDIRKAIDQLHVSTREMDSLQHRQQLQIDTVTEQRQTFTSEMSIAEERLQFMKEGQAFWNHTATHQGFKLLQACERLKVSSIADIHEQNSLASFQMTCVEYDESVAYGESRWDPRHLEMEFSCTQCSSWQNGWPMVDPAHTNALLCQSCVENMQVS